MMKILHIEPLRCNTATRKLLEASGMETDYEDIRHQEQLISRLGQKAYEVLFVKLGLAYNATVFDAAPSLRYIVTPTTGLDHIDTAEAEKRGIHVLSLKGETAFLKTIRSTAEHTWALLLALIRHVPEAVADTLQGYWRREPFLAGELNGKTLGIIGYGRLGCIVADYGKAFGMEVLVCDTDSTRLQQVSAGITVVDLDMLFQRSDIISIHIPSNEMNRNYIDMYKIGKMKAGVILINTARGEVIDEAALLSGLRSGHIAGAALDVLEGDSSWQEHIPENHPLLQFAAQHRQLIITPHMGGYGKESIEHTRLFMAQKFLKEYSR